MIQFKTKFYRALIILYSVVSIASTIYLLLRPSGNVTDTKYENTREELQHIKNYLKRKDSTYQKTIDSLESKADSLNRQLSFTQVQFVNAKEKSESLSGEVLGYIQKYQQDTLLPRNDLAFDTLSELSRNYVTESNVRDSLCDLRVVNLSQQLDLKEAEFLSADSLLNNYKSINADLLAGSLKLNDQLLKSDRKRKRSRNFNRLLTASAVVVTGFFIVKQLLPH